MKNKKLISGFFFLVLAQIMVGLNIVCSKLLLPTIPVFLLITIRFSIATFILLPLHWLTPAKKISLMGHLKALKARDWIFMTAQALTAGILFNSLMLTGLHFTDANVAGIITSTLPAIIVLLSRILLKEKITLSQSFSIGLATLGLVMIAYDKLQGLQAKHSFLGDLIVLLALLPEASYYILCKLHPNRLPIFLTSALMNAMNAILLLPCFFIYNLQGFSLANWFIIFVLGLSSGLFYVFWYIGCHRVEGALASLSTAVMPIATVLFAWLILGEDLTSWEEAGMAVVLFSIIFYARR